MATITTANSVLMLSIPGLYDTPVQLQGYAADAAFASDAVNTSETAMGIDGRLSGGYTPVATPFTITLQADSASNEVFETWQATQETAREALPGDMTILLPATSRKYTGTRGFLTSIPKIPTGQKTLQPRAYTITFESMQPAAG